MNDDTGTDRVELTDAERERIIEAIYQGRVRACRETVENWGPPEDEADTHSFLLRVLRGESEGFVANALPVVASIVAARVQAEVAMLREALEICRETESDF